MGKKNFYYAPIFDIQKDFDDFLKIYTQASKGAISPNLGAIHKFPQLSCIKNITHRFTFDIGLLQKCIKSFDQTLEIEKFLISMIMKSAGKHLLRETISKEKLSGKRKFQNRLVEDLLIIADSKFKLNNNEFKIALRLFSYTLNSSFLASPPSRIAKSTFEKWSSKMSIDDKIFLLSIYKLVGGFYCNQDRISKKNFRETSRIIFKLKHCSS
jgi:hypothetical protein